VLNGFTTVDIAAHLAGEDEETARRFCWWPQTSTEATVLLILLLHYALSIGVTQLEARVAEGRICQAPLSGLRASSTIDVKPPIPALKARSDRAGSPSRLRRRTTVEDVMSQNTTRHDSHAKSRDEEVADMGIRQPEQRQGVRPHRPVGQPAGDGVSPDEPDDDEFELIGDDDLGAADLGPIGPNATDPDADSGRIRKITKESGRVT
jgi:hypothetical protein